MVCSYANFQVTHHAFLPIRVYVNKRRLIENNVQQGPAIIEAPLLSSNSIVQLRNPSVSLYLSNQDMGSLCDELRTDLVFLLYELANPIVLNETLNKMRMGHSLDFVTEIAAKFGRSDHTNIKELTRESRSVYRLRYSGNWECDIFITNLKRLSQIRQYLLYGYGAPNNMTASRLLIREVLEAPKKEVEEEGDSISGDQIIPIEPSTETVWDVPDIDESNSIHGDQKKRPLIHRYRQMVNLGKDCISIHVVQRPRRHRSKD